MALTIAIINDVHVGKPLEHNNTLRASSHLVDPILPGFLDYLIARHHPDVIINLGDLIRGEGQDLDAQRYQKAIRHFKKAGCPVIHLIGNHELKHLSEPILEGIWEKEGFSQRSYGIKKIEGLSLIWLGMETKTKKVHQLPDDQLSWLEDTLEHLDGPALIFTHLAIDDHSLEGGFFYKEFEKEAARSPFFLANQEKIRSILSKSPNVKGVFQAHLHYFHTKTIDQVPFVTCPAFADNICGPLANGHLPEIFTLVTVDRDELVVKAFSKGYAFAGTEFKDWPK